MEFNLAEKLAIVKAIDEVILADGYVSQSEVLLLRELTKILKFESGLYNSKRFADGEILCFYFAKRKYPKQESAGSTF